MAEGYTQNFVLNKYAYNEPQSTFIQVYSETLSIDGYNGQDEIKSFDYIQGVLTFYDAYDNAVGNYNIDDIYNYNGSYKALEVVQCNGTDILDREKYNVPEWGGEFNAYYGGNPETGGNNTPQDPEPVITITLSSSNLSLSVGETGFITATTNSQQTITWGSADTTIATVDSSGNSVTVTAVSAGTTTITASVETKTASCTVTVSEQSEYILNIYDDTNTNIIKSKIIPKGEKINKYIYDTGVYNEINDRDEYYISEWRNHDSSDALISDTQTMDGDLAIYPKYTKLPTEYYSIVYLPDLTQRFPLGTGVNYSLGDTGGRETVTLTVSEMPSHRHNLSYVDSNGSNEDKYYS